MSIASSQVPYQLPTNVGWQYLQTAYDALTTPAAAGGVAEVDLEQVPAGQMWLIRRMAVSCTSSGVTFTAYRNQAAPPNIVDATDAGVGDVADETQPIVLNESDVLLCVWSGCPDAAVGSISVMRDVYKRVG